MKWLGDDGQWGYGGATSCGKLVVVEGISGGRRGKEGGRKSEKEILEV